jgi:hypothetical protein
LSENVLFDRGTAGCASREDAEGEQYGQRYGKRLFHGSLLVNIFNPKPFKKRYRDKDGNQIGFSGRPRALRGEE